MTERNVYSFQDISDKTHYFCVLCKNWHLMYERPCRLLRG